MNKIVTISREFGSGGREIGKRLADELGLRYYDREIIDEIAKETGMSKEYIQNISEKGMYPYPFQFAKSFATYSGLQSNQTEILVTQTKVVKEIAEKGNCIIVGRGANAILKDYNTMNIFVYADMESKKNRCYKKAREDEKITDKELEDFKTSNSEDIEDTAFLFFTVYLSCLKNAYFRPFGVVLIQPNKKAGAKHFSDVSPQLLNLSPKKYTKIR